MMAFSWKTTFDKGQLSMQDHLSKQSLTQIYHYAIKGGTENHPNNHEIDWKTNTCY